MSCIDRVIDSDDDTLEIVIEDEVEEEELEAEELTPEDLVRDKEPPKDPAKKAYNSLLERYFKCPRGVYKHPFKYKCPFCSKIYTSRSGLTSHKNTVHLKAKPYRCEICNEHFASSAGRVSHIHKFHRENRRQSEKIANSMVLVIQPPNIEKAAPKIRPLPNIIAKPVAQTFALQPKPKSILPEKSSAASIEILPHQSAVPLHAHSFPPSMPRSSESHECPKCDIHFEFVEDLLGHLANHSFLISADYDSEDDLKVPPKLTCFMCSFVPKKNGDEYNSLQEHIISVHFKANLPSIKSDSKTNNESPIKIVRSNWCQLCFKEFETPNQMEVHTRYHHKVTNNKSDNKIVVVPSSNRCQHCLKVFMNSDRLAEHLKEGCKTTTYNCKRCSAKFRHPFKLRRHMRRAHNINPSSLGTKPISVTNVTNTSKAVSILNPKLSTPTTSAPAPMVLASTSKVLAPASKVLAPASKVSTNVPAALAPPSKVSTTASTLSNAAPTLSNAASTLSNVALTGSTTAPIGLAAAPPVIYICGNCEETFTTEPLLRNHKIECSKTLNTCPLCKEVFDERGDLLKHFRSDHSQYKTSDKFLSCDKCSFSTGSIVLFTEHVKKHAKQS